MKKQLSTLALGLGLCAFSQATEYHVGNAYPLKKLADVAWNQLQPGDTVYIHYKNNGYHESFQLMNSGTAAHPIRVVGVSDPKTGRKAALNGVNAIVGPSINQGYYTYLYVYGGIIITPPKGFVWGDAPSYLSIENLEICNFKQTSKMTTLAGTKVNYNKFACGIYGERVRHLVVKDCFIHDNGNGFFTNSKYGKDALSQDLLIDHNTFLNNGNPNSFSEHHMYTEAEGVVVQNNTFGPLVPTSHGCAVKDRSAGTVVRNNSMVVSQYGIAVMFVGAQGGSNYIEFLPGYKTTYLYGNTFYNPPLGGEAFVLYGGDGYYPQSRRGTLYAYQNTFVNHADGVGTKRRLGTFAFRLPTMVESGGIPIEETVDARNNAFYCTSETPNTTPTDLSLLYTAGPAHLDLGVNWVSPTVKLTTIGKGGPFANPVITGTANLIVGATNNPGLPLASGCGIANPTAFLQATDPAVVVSLLDPQRVVEQFDPVLLFTAIDVPKLKTLTDPSLYLHGVRPKQLVKQIDPKVLVQALDPLLMIGLIDPTNFVALVDPTVLAGIIDPHQRPIAGSPLVQAGGALYPGLPIQYLPTTERFGLWTRTRFNRPLVIGALDSVH